MPSPDWLAEQFEQHRGHLRAVAYRMLGSAAEADDAVQESWIRLGRSDAGTIENLGGWLTTVVSRVCLDMLRTRASRREDPLDAHVPDPIVERYVGRTVRSAGGTGSAGSAETMPESAAIHADAVGLALMVVLETLEPAERLAFVLHDVFGMSFDDIAPIVERTPAAARQLASRARRRIQSGTPAPERDLRRQRQVIDAFLAAARDGDLERLMAVLDPDIVLRADAGALAGMSRVVRGARAVAEQAATFSRSGLSSEIVLVNGHVGAISRRADGRLFSVVGFTIADGRIVEMDILADPERLARIDLSALDRKP